jgi:hypothetical protein
LRILSFLTQRKSSMSNQAPGPASIKISPSFVLIEIGL